MASVGEGEQKMAIKWPQCEMKVNISNEDHVGCNGLSSN